MWVSAMWVLLDQTLLFLREQVPSQNKGRGGAMTNEHAWGVASTCFGLDRPTPSQDVLSRVVCNLAQLSTHTHKTMALWLKDSVTAV